MPTRYAPSSSPHEDVRPKKLPKMEDSLDLAEATTSVASVSSYRPDAKTRRYDRQLRLWASSGQRSLEQARILLIGCDATGSQSLKNLVLPGISHFTILSPLNTTDQDVATNFFLHPSSVGKPLATEVVKYLKELNPAVDGAACVQDPIEFLASNPSFFTSFTLVLCSNVAPDLEAQLAELLWQASRIPSGPDIPLFSIRNSGFIGRIKIQLREHCVVDTHPDTTHTLRIDQPFAFLEAYARGLDIVAMDSMEHSHVPYVVLLVRAGCEWRDSHGGKAPESDEEKDQFKNTLRRDRRKGDEENYDQALGQAYQVWNPSQIPYDLQSLLDEASVKKVSPSSKNLHILLHALRQYLQTHPLPPISPTLPDMHSSTTSYIALQSLYKEQYQADLEEYRQVLVRVLDGLGLPTIAVSEGEIEGFAKNSAGVAIVKGRPLVSASGSDETLKEAIRDHLSDPYSENQLAIAEHLAFLAAEHYYALHDQWPGSVSSSDISEEQHEVEKIVQDILGDGKELPEPVTQAISEITRGGFGCLPTTSAFLGGLVAQEVIKLVTNQYAPLDNTVIVDLVHSTTRALKL